MNNPLLATDKLPPFSQIKPEHVEPAIDRLLAENRQLLNELLEKNDRYGWDNLIAPLEAAEDRLAKAWSPVNHMNSVVNSDALRAAYNACLPKLSEHGTELGQNTALYEAYRQIRESDEYARLSAAQQKTIDNALRDFRLSGVALPEAKKARYKEIAQRLSELSAKFEENLLDATDAWKKHITDPALLSGLPESAQAAAKQAAEQKGLEGWLLTLEFPSFFPVMSYADNRELRREVYEAFSTRASDTGPNAGRWDNLPIMEEILKLRHEKAQLLGFDSYAELSLEPKMAGSTEEVMAFLSDLAERAYPKAQEDLAALQAFAREQDGLEKLEAWDIGYYSEKLRQARYQISQEDLRPYFPETRVIPGLFKVVERLYGLKIEQVDGADVWHPDVRFYEIREVGGELRGQFYFDLYAREKKRGGAWMADCRVRHRTADGLQIPVAYLTCNFSPPVGDKPALLTHDEVETLFHEFGHGLHHMLTRVDYPSVSGINGVPWDAVELPSQFMENWCWEREALDLFAAHYETGAPLPEELYQRMLAAKNFQSAMQMVRQLEFSLFDFRLHLEYDPARGARIYQILEEVRDQVAVVKPPAFNRFPNSFGHIFAGGYAAGYYSYKWAEVLSADAFSRFEEEGIFNRETGRSFLANILEKGGSQEAMDLFVAFRGRKPDIDALLRHNGLAA
ncbi:oligopeptidase A [Alkalilimnicola ehrlichii]|uniref:oligopeptidase A n=1 Tax=Alkalilimnicola ehrlichii TaxID=351052 RepID=A0A3E0X413_9GAMM|nr:oligopeptidase A [Alkalilimnicola ehrlichii]RFA39592.1 oligopeptidase A [Alkalilimnicola ehrlichii]